MTETIDPPQHDTLLSETTPECQSHREYSELVVGLMRAWDTSESETERRMEQYSLDRLTVWCSLARREGLTRLGQCEWLIREYNNCYSGPNPWR